MKLGAYGMKLWASMIAVGAVLASKGGAFAQGWATKDPHPTTTVFHCRVDAGPKLADCRVKDAAGIDDPRKIATLKSMVEGTYSCALGGFAIGSEVDYPLRVPRGEDLLAPHEPLDYSVPPDWGKPITANEMRQFYPRPGGVSGRAVMSCLVDAQGHTYDCVMMQETPRGYGFGEAGLKFAEKLRLRPAMRNCKPVDGGSFTFPLPFAAPGD